MANIIKPKRSNTAGKVPTTSDLTSGELGVNMADKKAYINNGTSVVQIGAGNLAGLGDVALTSPSNGQSLVYNGTNWVNQTGAGSGDVVGPSSATDNALARFDTTTGKLIQNSVVTLDDSGNEAGLLSQQFSDGTAVTLAAGKMWYNGTTGSWNLGMGGGNITQQVGEEIFIYGKASSAITEGQLVMKTGVVGASGVITFAPTTAGITDDDLIIGIATENIALNGFGRITCFGVVHGINTSAFTDGDTLWYNPAVGSGGMTATKPTAPNVKCQVGTVINAGSGGSGSIQVLIIHGSQLGGTDSNVNLSSPSNGQILTYDTSNSYWKNTTLTAGTAISVSAATGGALTITNTAPDQTVVLTGAGTTTVTGTYPNFTITSNDQYTGTVTSVGMTVPTGLSISGSPITTSGTLALTFTAGYSIPTTASQTNWDSAYTQRLQWDGGSTNLVAATGRTSLGATTLGANIFTITNPSAVTFPRFNADNTVSALDAATFRTAIGAGTGSGTVTSVSGTSPVSVATGTTTPVISLASGYGDTQNPYASKTANYVLAAPNGSAGVPTFRAIVAADIPTLNQNTTGSSGSCTGNAATATTASGVSAGVVAGKMIYDTFTANGSTTSFTTSATYTSGKIEVYCNGVKMRNGSDVTVTSGTAVVFASAPANTSLIDVVYPT